MIAQPTPYPRFNPPEHAPLPEEPVYDPARHLALGEPEEAYTLDELGYKSSVVHDCPSEIAVTTPFRMLSDEGVEALRQVIAQLRVHARGDSDRSPAVLGCAYRSTFVRDLCACPVVTSHLSKIAGAPLAPHSMPSIRGHLSFGVSERGEPTTRWHTDTVPLVSMLVLSNLESTAGGTFDFFNGPKESARHLLKERGELPKDLVVSVKAPAPGWTVMMQGDMVMHRASAPTDDAEQITMINGYTGVDLELPDHNRLDGMGVFQDPRVLMTEWARHKAWRSSRKLQELVTTLPFTGDRDAICAALRDAIRDVEEAIADIQSTSPGKAHGW